MKKLVGLQFGYLTVIGRVKGDVRGSWLCKCECGNEVTVRTDKLTGTGAAGHIKRSCGCKTYEIRTKTNELNGVKPGRKKAQ